MNLKEAYTTLELPQGASEAEAKKKFRELSKKLHPDNKETGDEAKFKKINEAYQRIQAGEDDPREAYARGGPGPIRYQQVIELTNVDVGTVISFKEAVLGLKKEIKYPRQAKCTACGGAGEVKLNNGCKKCGGRGQVVNKQTSGNQSFVSISTCNECYGKASVSECTRCKGEGLVHTDVSVHVSIPAGIQDGTTLRLQGMGNYAGSLMGMMDQYTDAFLHVTVTPDPNGLRIEGQSVVSNLTISLLDALRGCERNVKTVFGSANIKVKPGSRNKDEVIIPDCGVGGSGTQRVILDVQYPKNTDKLVGVLIDEVI